MYNRAGRHRMVRFDNWQGAPAEMSADAPIGSAWISKKIQIWDGRQKWQQKYRRRSVGL